MNLQTLIWPHYSFSFLHYNQWYFAGTNPEFYSAKPFACGGILLDTGWKHIVGDNRICKTRFRR